MPFLIALFCVCFIAGVSIRLLDPLVPQIAREFGTTTAAAALLTTAYTLPYAIALPFIGGLGDAFGKVRMIKFCLAWMTIATIISAIAWTYEMLFISRALTGIVGGSIIPLAMAVVGDRYPIAERQVALSRLLTAMMASQVFGMSAAGVIADSFGWRVVVWLLAAMALAGLAYSGYNLQPRSNVQRAPFSIGHMADGYKELFSNNRAKWCFLAAGANGLIVFGLLPWIAPILETRGTGSIREAGFVIAGMGLGGLLYSMTVRQLLHLTGSTPVMMYAGGLTSAVALFIAALLWPWYLQMIAFVVAGLGFFMFHGSIQAIVSEVSPKNRGSAVAIHSTSFISGQAAGPLLYAGLLHNFGPTLTIAFASLASCVLYLAVSFALKTD